MNKLSDKARMYARKYGQPPYGREIEGTAELLLQMADKLAEYEDLEEQEKLLKLPCAVGDFALFSNGIILPVVYITLSNPKEGISVGCQNGINISMNLQYGSWCKGFFKTRDEAETALSKADKGGVGNDKRSVK